jgi:hypothetical protein
VNHDREAHVVAALHLAVCDLCSIINGGRLAPAKAEPIRAIARRLAGAASVLDEPEFVRPARDPP